MVTCLTGVDDVVGKACSGVEVSAFDGTASLLGVLAAEEGVAFAEVGCGKDSVLWGPAGTELTDFGVLAVDFAAAVEDE